MRVAVARDEAFNFTYRANLDALGADVTYFSPLRDAEVPPCQLLYLPGGYPELFAPTLAANTAMRRSVRAYAEGEGHVIAECGGFMYLCHDIDGEEMVGIFPHRATMQDARLTLGYREMTAGGITFRGHEFHYSRLISQSPNPLISRYKNVVAGYPHWYWGDKTMEQLWHIFDH